jgi:magnesium-transporting ATPase (P-type)
MDVLCVDKTGTLTLNKLSVSGVVILGAANKMDLLRVGTLASQAANQDPVDLALLAAAEGLPAITRISFTPFVASTRRTEAVFKDDGVGGAEGRAHGVGVGDRQFGPSVTGRCLLCKHREATMIRQWKKALLEGAAGIFERGGQAAATAEIAEDTVRDLHAKIGELAVANDFL